jgi:hypothetical protein
MLSDRCRGVNPLPAIPWQSFARPASGGRAVVNGAANATSGVSALRASIPCRKQCGVRLRRTRYLSLAIQAITVLAPSTPQARRAPLRFAPIKERLFAEKSG